MLLKNRSQAPPDTVTNSGANVCGNRIKTKHQQQLAVAWLALFSTRKVEDE
jgi:hypothetical protein